MTPEQLQQFEEMRNQLEQVVSFINKLDSVETIPFNVQEAFKSRLGSLKASSKAVSSKSVNEGATAQYTVAKVYDEMVEVSVDGQIKYIGVYTS